MSSTTTGIKLDALKRQRSTASFTTVPPAMQSASGRGCSRVPDVAERAATVGNTCAGAVTDAGAARVGTAEPPVAIGTGLKKYPRTEVQFSHSAASGTSSHIHSKG